MPYSPHNWDKVGIDISKLRGSKMRCPKCNHKDSLSCNLTTGLYKCHHIDCDFKSCVADKPQYHNKKDFTPPLPRLQKVSDEVANWFEKERKISNNTLLLSKITESTSSQATYKQIRTLTIDAPYQNDPVVADLYSNIILNLHKTPRSTTKTISYYTSNDTNRCYFLGLTIGSKIPVAETVTGISENYFIQNISWSLVGYNQNDGAIIKVTYLLKLARMDVFEFAKWDTVDRGWESDYGWAE